VRGRGVDVRGLGRGGGVREEPGLYDLQLPPLLPQVLRPRVSLPLLLLLLLWRCAL